MPIGLPPSRIAATRSDLIPARLNRCLNAPSLLSSLTSLTAIGYFDDKTACKCSLSTEGIASIAGGRALQQAAV